MTDVEQSALDEAAEPDHEQKQNTAQATRSSTMSIRENKVDLDSIAPESLREQVADLPLTASHAALFPESLVWRKTVYSGIPDDEPAPTKEIWPRFECRACGATREIAYEPAPGFEGEVPDRYDTIQFVWNGRRPVCNRCGSGLSDQRIERSRPPRWQQPIIGVLCGVPYLSETHDPLMDTFEYDPMRFIRADRDDLRAIDGIGERFARQIIVKKHAAFGELAPCPDPEWPELHAQAKREARFA